MEKGILWAKRAFLLFALAVVVIVSTTTETNAFVSMSEDQVTCTPCHEDGRKGDGKGGEIHPDGSLDNEEAKGEDKKGDKQDILAKYQTTMMGNLVIAPAAPWDDLWTWVQAQPPVKAESK
ncbi:hypothetical protein Dhaf_0776 [Desulfitobacterium hafniense DCB-2]|uniref:Uncharacterized protein n=1 Tax=Desulfitobacterium hafniense (strain DSM 10664 / DCB-2) TaxID=272564 RepID=B8FWV4_DESHD|nr:hypothetical protein [Desulfitobacterium hafniense]ACL18840.1 hypothetical protein Dhaf_0776 [Desulfitobacterium hafniense DCB-2]